ncbi:hypothetical protein [Kitasatospora sp. NPDC001547]|uniref:hypothetical protein n=1 Tax=Kitasatospora sp. NPDC001547 TaxID=3364015 RepID=UPI00368CD90E|nr:hypothetical protein KitaXyl93_35750 [Kitasatospora sp. Xyl93]
MTPEPAEPRGARRRWRLPVAAAVGLVLAAGAVFYLGGGYDRWQDGRSLAGLCHGSVDTAEVRALLGADRVRGKDAGAPEGLAACSVDDAGSPGNGYLDVRIDRGAEGVGTALHTLGRDRPSLATSMVMPLGHGRRGVLDLQGRAGATAVTALDCPGQGKEGLLVTVHTVPAGGDRLLDDPAQRARFARIAARAADGAARVWGCTAPSGPEITDVPADTRYVKVPDGAASGTCAGLSGTVNESPADPDAPVEDCFLYAGQDAPRFRLGAYYPPFANRLPAVADYPVTGPAGGRDGLAWATAACPGGGTALFTVDTVFDGNRAAAPDPALEKDALRTFATRSAQRHGCSAPQLP